MAKQTARIAAGFVGGLVGLWAMSAQAVPVDPIGPPALAFAQAAPLVSDPVQKLSPTNADGVEEPAVVGDAGDVSPVPIPPALALFGGALTGLAVLARKRKRTLKLM
jgi:hypothetical protein